MDTVERVNRAAELFAEAARTGRVELPVLDDDEECVLGDGRWALGDAGTWRRWSALPDVERAAAEGRAVAALRERGLVEVHDTGDRLRLDLAPELGVVASARTAPAFLVTVQPAAEPLPRVAPLVYAVADEVAGLRGLVVELRGEGKHAYRLMSPERAAEGLAAWAHRAVTSEDWGARWDTVVLEVLRHRAGEPLEAAAVSVAGPEAAKEGMTLFFGGARERHPDQEPAALTGQVETLLRQAVDGIRP